MLLVSLLLGDLALYLAFGSWAAIAGVVSTIVLAVLVS